MTLSRRSSCPLDAAPFLVGCGHAESRSAAGHSTGARRARRRSAEIVGVAVSVVFGGGAFPGASLAVSSAPELPPAARILGTTPVSLRDTALTAARGGSGFVVITEATKTRSIELVRIVRGGAVRRVRLPFDQPSALRDVSAGRDGVYAGTAVIKRFSNRRDELIRIDPHTLTIAARATFSTSVAAVEAGNRMWATLGDGHLARLDPLTLRIEASTRILPARAATTGAATASRPAFGLGSVWVLAGSSRKLELIRLDPRNLTVRSRTRVPTGGRLAQALDDVTADTRHVYLVGGAIAQVDRSGRIHAPRLVPGLAAAAVYERGLVGLTNERAAVVRLDSVGHVVARTTVQDAGAAVAVSGHDAWFLGSAGRGNGIVHVRLLG